MSEQGAALQTYNQELVKGIEALKRRRSELLQSMKEDEQQKEVLEKEMASVKEKLMTVCSRLNDRLQKKAYYDNAIENSETAYMKILESSQALLSVVRQEARSIEHSKPVSP